MKLPGGRGVQTQAKGTRVLLHLRKDVFLDINRFPRCPMLPRSTMWVVTCFTVIRRLLFDFKTSSRHRCRQVIIHEPQGMEKDLEPVTQTYAKSNDVQSCPLQFHPKRNTQKPLPQPTVQPKDQRVRTHCRSDCHLH